MANEDLVSGNKVLMISRIKQLKVLHGRDWRKLLKKHNTWHQTEQGRNAWENIRKGSTGNDALRLILDDMETIAASPILETKKVDPDSRNQLITSSLSNLKTSSKRKIAQ